MAAIVRSNNFLRDLAAYHLIGTHTFKLALSNSAVAASVADLSGVTEIGTTAGYSAGGLTLGTGTASVVTTDDAELTFADSAALTSAGGANTFRYGVIYNDSITPKRIVGVVDYGSTTVPDGSSWYADMVGAAVALS
jgi:hypothetical protein